MKKILSEEEALMEREGFGRFNLRKSAEIHPVAKTHRRTPSGPRSVITNRATRNMPTIGWDRVWYTPRLTKDAMDNDVRIMVPRTSKRP